MSGVQSLQSTIDWAQSAGDLIVLLINYDSQVGTNVVSDTSGNVYTQFGSPASDPTYGETMYYCLGAKAAAASANIVTVDLSAPAMTGTFSINLFGFSAPGRTWIQDQYSNDSQMNTADVTSGAVTTRFANEVLVAGTGVDTSVVKPTDGWIDEGVDNLGDRHEFLIVDSVQTGIAATFTQRAIGYAVSQLGTFAAMP
jgi:hypothetical protein